jgi:hypothetical protein
MKKQKLLKDPLEPVLKHLRARGITLPTDAKLLLREQHDIVTSELMKLMKPDAERGKKFRGQGRSADSLGKIIEETYLRLRKARKKEPLAREVFNNLPAAPGTVITAVENDVIYWTGAKGREEEMTFNTFKTRLTRLKKKIPA